MEESSVTVLQSAGMGYSQGVPLYRDRPNYGLVMKLIVALPVVLIGMGIYYWSTGDNSGGTAFVMLALVIGLVFWFVFPREYRVYEDYLQIALGGPFSIKIGFDSIREITVTGRSSLSINFVTRITRNCVEIARRKGPSITITPTAAESFVEEANRALGRWTATRSQ